MVGEVRDLETAQICVRAALTGHLVLSPSIPMTRLRDHAPYGYRRSVLSFNAVTA